MNSSKLFLLLLFISLTLSAQTLDEIILKHFEAIGHKNLLKKNSFVANGKIVQGKNEIPFTSYSKRPDKFRMDGSIQEYKFTQAYDGKTGWVINPMMGINKPMELPPSEVENLKFQADFDGFFYNYKDKGRSLEYIGNDEVSGMNTYVILLTKSSGDSMYIYLDAQNYLMLKTRAKAYVGGQPKYINNIYSDYRSVEGILSAYNVETQVEGTTFTQLIYDSYDYSPDVPDSIFIFKSDESEESPESDKSE
jgi:outer membrane lipoprotein-sorting protein